MLHGSSQDSGAGSTWTSKVPKIMAQYPKIESLGNPGSIILCILGSEPGGGTRQAFEGQTQDGRELLSILAANAAQMCPRPVGSTDLTLKLS